MRRPAPTASRRLSTTTCRGGGVTATPLPGNGGSLAAPASVGIEGFPTTRSVRLHWDAVPGAGGYRVYRSPLDPAPDGALGLPLAEILSATNVSFEDLLDLRPLTYFYSVVALDSSGRESAEYATVSVEVTRVTTAAEAVAKGLIENAGDVRPGR